MITLEAESELLEFIVISFGVTIGGKVFQIVVIKTVKSVRFKNTLMIFTIQPNHLVRENGV